MQRKDFFICPRNDLINLVRVLSPNAFDFLSKEPIRDETDELAINLNPEATEFDLDKFYEEYSLEYGKKQRLANRLFRYENTLEGGRQNIISNLGIHVINCGRCSKEYHRFINGCAVEAVRREKNKGLPTTIVKRDKAKMIKRLYHGFIRDIDKAHLQLARYIFPEVR